MEPTAISFRVQPLLPEFFWLFQWTPYVLNVIQILILRKIHLNKQNGIILANLIEQFKGCLKYKPHLNLSKNVI